MTLFLYQLKDFFKYVAWILVFCIVLFIFFDFIHKSSSYFPKHDAKYSDITGFYFYQIPSYFLQAVPIASLLASAITMILFSRSGEISAMRACGMSPLRISLPILIGGGLLSLSSILVGEWITPISSTRMHRIQQIQIEKQHSTGGLEQKWFKKDNTLYHVGDFDIYTNTLTNIMIIKMGSKFRPKQSITAKRAVLKEENIWRLLDVNISYFNKNGSIGFRETSENQLSFLPFQKERITEVEKRPLELSVSELYQKIATAKGSGQDSKKLSVDFHVKMASYFAAFILSWMGLGFGFLSERKTETARGILIAVIMGMSYWVILNFSRTLASGEILPAWPAAWSANAILFLIGFVQFKLKTK